MLQRGMTDGGAEDGPRRLAPARGSKPACQSHVIRPARETAVAGPGGGRPGASRGINEEGKIHAWREQIARWRTHRHRSLAVWGRPNRGLASPGRGLDLDAALQSDVRALLRDRAVHLLSR